MKVEIWSKDNCGYCDMAIRLAEQKEIDTVVKKLGVDFEREALVESYPTARSFPVVIVDGEYIGGYTEFAKLVNN